MSKLNSKYYELETDDSITEIIIYTKDHQPVGQLHNVEGQSASFRIYLAMAKRYVCHLNIQSAHFALELYGDYVGQEQQNPGQHPNIRRLLDVIEREDEFLLELITSN